MNPIILKIENLLLELLQKSTKNNIIIGEKFSEIIRDLKNLTKNDFKYEHKFEWLQNKLYNAIHEDRVQRLISSLLNDYQCVEENEHYLATGSELHCFLNSLKCSI